MVHHFSYFAARRSLRAVAGGMALAVLMVDCGGHVQPTVPISPAAAGAHISHTQSIYSSTCVPAAGQVAGTVTEYPIPTTNTQPRGLAVDSNGAIWFSEWNASAIGKLVPSTQTWTQYPTPTHSSQPKSVAIGPDGNPWFVEFAGDKYGKISGGAVIEYSAPRLYPEQVDVSPAGTSTAGLWVALNNSGTNGGLDAVTTTGGNTLHGTTYSPYGMSADSTGNIWYTSYNPNYIGVYFANGTQGLWSIPTASSHPWSISEGPSGTGMWFTEYTAGKIANITSAGKITEYSIPTTNSGPQGLVSACGNVWFAENTANKIAEFNPTTKAFTEYPVPTTNSGPSELSVDGSGNVWFSEENSNKIAMITTTTAANTNGELAVLDTNNSTIYVYPPGANSNTTPTATISLPSGTAATGRITFDPSGNLWYAGEFGYPESFGILEYGAPLTTNETPARTITDSTGGLGFPMGISFNATLDEIFVADATNATISSYDATANGSVAPLGVIGGSNTGILNQFSGQYSPSKLATDANYIYLAQSGDIGHGPGLSKFALSASGNVAPTQTMGEAYLSSFEYDVLGHILTSWDVTPNSICIYPATTTSLNACISGVAQQASDIATDDNAYVYMPEYPAPAGVNIYGPYTDSTIPSTAVVQLTLPDSKADPYSIAVYSPAKAAGSQPK